MSLFKSTAWYTFGNLFSRFLGFILLPFYSNFLTTSDFGTYALIMSAYSVFAAIYQGGLFSGFSKYFVEAEENKKKDVFSSIFAFILLTSLCLSTLATIFQSNIAQLLLRSPNSGRLIFVAAWMLFSDTIFAILLHLLKTKEQSGKVAYYTLASAIFNLLFNLIFVFYQRKGVEGILLAQLFSGAIVASSMFPIIIDNLRFRINTEFLKKVLIFSLPLLIGGIFSTLVDVADRFILDRFLDVKSVGIYSFSYRIAMLMNVFVISFGTAWTPYFLRIYKNDNALTSELFGKNFTKLLAVSLLIFLAVSLLIGDLFHFKLSGAPLFNGQYEPGIIIIPFVLAGYAFRGLIGFYSVYPYVSGKSYHFLISDSLAFIVNIILNFIMIPMWGILGAAIATMLSFAVGLLYLFVVSRGIKILYQKKELLQIIASAAIIFCTAQIVNSLLLDIVLIIAFTIVIQRVLKIGTTAKAKAF